jgi:hypothetical protein
MARLYGYKSAREIMAGVHPGNDLSIHLKRISVFILERCGIKDIEEDYEIFKEAVSKSPLLFDFALSRFINSIDSDDQVRYYIPKSEQHPWSEVGVYYNDIFPYETIRNMYNQDCGYYEFYLNRDFKRDVYNLYFEDSYDLGKH